MCLTWSVLFLAVPLPTIASINCSCWPITQGLRKPKEWVDFVWQILNAQGHLLMHEGKTLQTEKENRAELLRLAQIFVDKYLVIARALAVVAD